MNWQTEKEYRCKNCGKLLAKGNTENLSIVCPRCKVFCSWKYKLKSRGIVK